MASQRQIEANRRNWAKRRGLTPRGRERLRQAALRNQPWQHSTGPRTVEGRARSRLSALKHGEYSAIAKAQAAWASTLTRITTECWYGECAQSLWLQFNHPPPDELDIDIDIAMAWLRAHRVLGDAVMQGNGAG